MEGIKRYLVLFWVCFVIASCSNQVEKINQWKEYELKGKVQTLKTCTYSASEKFGEIVKDSLIEIEIVYFNENGYIDSIYSSLNQSLYYSCSNSMLKGDVMLIYTSVYDWDFDNNICMFNTYGSLYMVDEGFVNYPIIRKLQYDEHFDKILSSSEYENDSLISKDVWVYNEYKQLVDYTRYDGKGNLICRKNNYEYNEKGLLVQEKWYDKNGELDNVVSYRYDDNGNQIGEKWDDRNRISKRLYKYNEYGLIVNEKYNYNSKMSSYSSTDITEYSYKLDKVGNYIVKTEKEYDEDDRSEVECTYIEREITYFN